MEQCASFMSNSSYPKWQIVIWRFVVLKFVLFCLLVKLYTKPTVDRESSNGKNPQHICNKTRIKRFHNDANTCDYITIECTTLRGASVAAICTSTSSPQARRIFCLKMHFQNIKRIDRKIKCTMT